MNPLKRDRALRRAFAALGGSADFGVLARSNLPPKAQAHGDALGQLLLSLHLLRLVAPPSLSLMLQLLLLPLSLFLLPQAITWKLPPRAE